MSVPVGVLLLCYAFDDAEFESSRESKFKFTFKLQDCSEVYKDEIACLKICILIIIENNRNLHLKVQLTDGLTIYTITESTYFDKQKPQNI